MARNFTTQHTAPAFTYRTSEAAPDVVPTTLVPAAAFDPDADEYVIIDGVVPDEFTGSGTLKLDLFACANTTTAADDAQIDVATEFRTPGADEALNADNFDATADSGTFTFSTTAYSLQKLTITLTPAVTPVAGDRFRIRITRDADHATLDSLAVDLLLVQADFYEEV